jgi:hypothetical protein
MQVLRSGVWLHQISHSSVRTQCATNAAHTAAEKPFTGSAATRSNFQIKRKVQRFSAASGATCATVKWCNRAELTCGCFFQARCSGPALCQ